MMMIKKLVSRNVRLSTKMSRRMCVEKVKEEEEELSVHLRPYDKEKYEQPSGHIKYNSGYAFLDVDPFPRASIMKLCYAILDKLALHIPPHAMYRQYTEEQIKYIMNLTDQIHDIRRLEEQLGFDSIEMFIQSLNDELSLVDDMKRIKPWEELSQPQDEIFQIAPYKREELKHILNEKKERERIKFIGK